MPIDVSDVRSNPNDQIAHAAKVIGRSKDRRKVFCAIYHGKKRTKTASEIADQTRLPRKRVLEEAVKLSSQHIVDQIRVEKEPAYVRDSFFMQNKQTILKLAGNKKALKEFPTKSGSKTSVIHVRIPFPRKMVDIKCITIDQIDSFAKVRGLSSSQKSFPTVERNFKEGLQRILGERGSFTDWGGETDDLFSTRLIIAGQRKNVAFGLKGRGTAGKLTPEKMGKRGDQIQRLFRAPAEVFLVQYWEQIDQSIIEQMQSFATAKSALEGKRIYFGVIDGQDTSRLLQAYAEHFETAD